MKTLLVLRHAKSDWNDPTLVDHDRTLNARGRRDAPRVARFLLGEDAVPEAIVSSTAVRARETADLVAETCGFEGRIETTEALYHAPPETIVDVIRERGGFRDRLMIVAHNPGIASFVAQLSGNAEAIPTTALAWFEVEADTWATFDLDAPAQLVTIWRPKERDD